MNGCLNRVRNLCWNLKATGGKGTEVDVDISVLNGLTSTYQSPLMTLAAKGADEPMFTCCKCRQLQEERRQAEESPVVKRTG